SYCSLTRYSIKYLSTLVNCGCLRREVFLDLLRFCIRMPVHLEAIVVSGSSDIRTMRLRSIVIDEFQAAGWRYDENGILCPPKTTSKSEMRDSHGLQRRERASHLQQLYYEHGRNLLKWFAEGSEIDPESFDPQLLPVMSSG